MSLLASLGTSRVSAELGTGDLLRERLWLSLFRSHVDRRSARASRGFYWFPSKSGSAQNKGSRLGNILVAAFVRGCHPFQPTA